MALLRWNVYITETDAYLALMTLSFLSFLLSGCFVFLGSGTMRTIAFPVVLLIFTVPFPGVLQGWVEWFLQHSSAQAADVLFRMSATPIFRQGLVFELPGFSFQVAAECSGIHSTLAWARFENGDAVGALALIRTVWGHMRHGSPYYSGGVWEALAPDGSPATRESAGGTFASLAHGWASGPTSALSKYVLGVRPIQPGYKTWLIEPQPGDLSWAEGRVPTPYGPIAVRWQKSPRGLRLELNVPNGTSGSVGLPTSSNADSVTDNDRPVKKSGKMTAAASESEDSSGARPGYAYLADLGLGVHVIQVTGGER